MNELHEVAANNGKYSLCNEKLGITHVLVLLTRWHSNNKTKYSFWWFPSIVLFNLTKTDMSIGNNYRNYSSFICNQTFFQNSDYFNKPQYDNYWHRDIFNWPHMIPNCYFLYKNLMLAEIWAVLIWPFQQGFSIWSWFWQQFLRHFYASVQR